MARRRMKILNPGTCAVCYQPTDKEHPIGGYVYGTGRWSNTCAEVHAGECAQKVAAHFRTTRPRIMRPPARTHARTHA